MEYFDYGVEEMDFGFDVERFLEESQRRQEQRLEQHLERISKQLEERNRIFEENQSELESKLDWYIDQLEKEYRLAGSDAVDELKEQIAEFYRLLRRERVDHWQDKQDLKQERRELLCELDELDESVLEWL